MSAELRLKRDGVMGFELRPGPIDIVLDGTPIGTIKGRETFKTRVEEGRHTLRLHAGRYSSGYRSFDVLDDEVANFQCHNAMLWPRYVISLLKPDWAISLRHI